MLGFPRETHNTHQLAVPHHSFTDTCDFCNVAKLKQLILKNSWKGVVLEKMDRRTLSMIEPDIDQFLPLPQIEGVFITALGAVI